jgi:hypothetical protein
MMPMEAWFEEAGLPTPPVPEQFRARIDEIAQQTWATGPVDPFLLYAFGVTRESLSALGTDSFAVSHAGHGANSYAISLLLAVPGLTVAVQEGWGGAYMEPDEARSDVAGMFDAVADCLAAVPKGPDQRQRCVAMSSFRDISYVGWLDDFEPEPEFETPHAWASVPERLRRLAQA